MSSARRRRLALAAGLLLVAAAAASAGVASAAEFKVAIIGKAFRPDTITINAGDTVTWTVEGAIGEPHSVTAEDQSFDSGIGEGGNSILEDNGQTFEHTFNEPGEFAYFCTIHPTTMTGTVVVVAEGASAPPAAEPSGEPSGEPGEPAEDHPPISTDRKIAAGAILAVGLVLMFGMAWVWRRMNPA